ncbi:MAG: hypothetical protein E7E64_10910 [Clostridium celatum]|nr:hypothetical protein [Clostridium celatum]MDU2123042.1 hypothetical protein [Clostridium celatum]MDU4979101.1 hypothetical protein [Clostridium celatum]
MFEIIVAIIVVGCIIYMFKGDFARKNVGVTVLENLPLSIFKKWGKENNKIEGNTIEDLDKPTNIESANEILNEVAITGIDEESKEVEAIDIKENINEINDEEKNELIENKESVENINEEIKEKDIVYWTPRGKTYHAKSNCRTLSRSKVINSGTVYESGKDCKCEHCK